jgi:hypothetical protein
MGLTDELAAFIKVRRVAGRLVVSKTALKERWTCLNDLQDTSM